jgi:hypothetical protein
MLARPDLSIHRLDRRSGRRPSSDSEQFLPAAVLARVEGACSTSLPRGPSFFRATSIRAASGPPTEANTFPRERICQMSSKAGYSGRHIAR